MIIGTGIDIVDVDRIGDRLGNEAFLKKVFSDRERQFCDSKPRKAEHYAARFAAKEAFLKALGLGLTAEHDLCNIEVLSEETGKPYLMLHGSLEELRNTSGWKAIHISLSHIASVACAVVIIES